jgi:hypothetical protein
MIAYVLFVDKYKQNETNSFSWTRLTGHPAPYNLKTVGDFIAQIYFFRNKM